MPSKGNHYTTVEWLLTDHPHKFGLIKGCANPTGVALFLILLIMFICSQPFVRRGGSFEIFYWTHLLYIPFWILLIFHGPNFWKWFIGPGLIFVIERLMRFAWMRSGRGKTYISSGLLLPSKVTHLVIKRPIHFYFRPGDYVFVNIPSIAKYEWHPFTLSSAPEQEDYMWLHIRGVGEWTNRLYSYFEKEQERLHNGEVPPMIIGRLHIESEKKVETPQKDFLARHRQQLMLKGNNLDSKTPDSNDNQVMQESKTTQTNGHEMKQIMPVQHDSADRRPKLSRQISENKTFRLIQSSLQRTFSTKGRQSPGSGSEYHNDGFSSDETDSEGQSNESNKKSKEMKLNEILLRGKVPLEKSLSMPDMQTKLKKNERIKV